MDSWSRMGRDTSIRIWRWVFLGIGLMSGIALLGRVVGIFHMDGTDRVVSWHSLVNIALELAACVVGPWLWWMTRLDKDARNESTEV
jgi:hypothetical protein